MGLAERNGLRSAYVLHQRSYRETSLLVDVFSEEGGRLRVLAKGAKRGRAAWSGLLQPFVPLSLSWSGRGELPVLSAAEPRGSGIPLSGRSLFCGIYMNELLLRFLSAHDPHEQVFADYEESLRRLAGAEPMDEVLRFFELALLEEIGYGLELELALPGPAPILPEKHYLYIPEAGPREIEPGMEAVRGSTLLGLKAGHLEGDVEHREAKRLMRRIIDHHLGGTPLKSRDLFKSPKSN
jgi:DNA repair protein RecO (recombination protein O)